MRSCMFAFRCSQSLNSNKVGLSQCFFTICKHQDSLRLGGSFCTTWFSKYELRKLASYDNDYKIPAKFEITDAKAITFSELCIFKGR